MLMYIWHHMHNLSDIQGDQDKAMLRETEEFVNVKNHIDHIWCNVQVNLNFFTWF